MEKSIYYVVGVMSGTSVDGIDICYARFIKTSQWKFDIIHAETIKYTSYWKHKLSNAIDNHDEVCNLDIEYSIFLSKTIHDFIKKYSIEENLLISSHGHTVFHQPHKGITIQIGNCPEIKSHLNHPVVCDFRIQDVKLGGQGAPLVPIGDKFLFYDYEYCLNLGGFANISFEENAKRIAFDICPVNIVLNHYCKELGLEFDDKGLISERGRINQELLSQLNALDFYKKEHPKSLGLEWVKDKVFPIIDNNSIAVKDTLCTFTEHIAIQISKILEGKSLDKVLVTGGGAFNTFLMSRLKANTKYKIVVPEREIVDFKEALIFGLLGVLKLRNEPNCLNSVTGASHDHSSGKIYK